jgi:hypothetical protein
VPTLSQKLQKSLPAPSLRDDKTEDLTRELTYILTVLKFTLHITRMVYVIAFSSPDSLVISSISLCDQNYSHLSSFRYRDKSCYRDNVNRAAGQRTVVMVFAMPFRQFSRDGTNPANLSGLSRLDNFIMTRKRSSIYRDFAKTHANLDTDGNCPYHRAVSGNLQAYRTLTDIKTSTK